LGINVKNDETRIAFFEQLSFCLKQIWFMILHLLFSIKHLKLGRFRKFRWVTKNALLVFPLLSVVTFIVYRRNKIRYV